MQIANESMVVKAQFYYYSIFLIIISYIYLANKITADDISIV